MTVLENFIEQFEQEAVTTRKMLSRVAGSPDPAMQRINRLITLQMCIKPPFKFNNKQL